MNKAKIMILSLALIAGIGGALAFKAKTLINPLFCTNTTVGVTKACAGAFNATSAAIGIVGFKAWCTNLPNETCTYPLYVTTVESLNK